MYLGDIQIGQKLRVVSDCILRNHTVEVIDKGFITFKAKDLTTNNDKIWTFADFEVEPI